ncbi:mitochondrial carrier domain-containing protein [Sphaerosporella brunnea]|uniref:Mitochondrial carrier domain-containing protein n=1 Tax=Sphaerosporella brunnea TaxID=1250544 RepID=A0A5J5F8P5_9PEZI|nr:mitochondrial carrier domain-containing protein [Sphaerosporella brunnea]
MSDNVLHAVAGAGGGVLSMILTYPLITLSTRSQVESKRAQTTFLDATRHIIQREGFGGLYAGLDSAVFGISVTNFVYYYWYEWSRAAFETAAIKAGRSRKLSTIESMIAGAVAGSATVLCTNPIWVVNTRMTARKRSPSVSSPTGAGKPTLAEPQDKPVALSTIGEIRALLKEGGIGAFFAGVMPALVLVINPILQYTIFEQLKNLLERRRKRNVTPSDAFVLGAIGKLVATGLTYPYITVKSRMHVAGKDDRNGSVFEALRRIVREEGWKGLYGGIGPKLVQSVITAAFLFAFKDALFNVAQAMLKNKRAQAKLLKK